MGQEIKIRKNPEILPGTLTLGISRNWDNFFCTEFSRKIKKSKNKMKIENKNLRKYKIKKFIFFKSKLGQEIKIRKNPEKTGKIRKSKK